MSKQTLIAAVLLALTLPVTAQTSKTLHDEVASLDRAMFEAYNAHDLDRLMTFFDKDLEFFHDTGGLVSYTQVRDGFKSIFARNDGIRRDLVDGSLEIHPVKDYGAIEIGAHRFCHVENGKDDCGTFRFVHVWRHDTEGWRVTRIISYGH